MGDYNDAYMRNNNGANVQGRVKTQNRPNVQQLKAVILLFFLIFDFYILGFFNLFLISF